MNAMMALRNLNWIYNTPIQSLTTDEKALVISSLYCAWIKDDMLIRGSSAFLWELLTGEVATVPLTSSPLYEPKHKNNIEQLFNELMEDSRPDTILGECLQRNISQKYLDFTEHFLNQYLNEYLSR